MTEQLSEQRSAPRPLRWRLRFNSLSGYVIERRGMADHSQQGRDELVREDRVTDEDVDKLAKRMAETTPGFGLLNRENQDLLMSGHRARARELLDLVLGP